MNELGDSFLELQREYLTEVPARLNELREAAGRFRSGDPEGAASLRLLFHRLAGSGGSYGFPEISRIARELEQWIVRDAGTSDAEQLEEGLERLARAFRRAGELVLERPAPPGEQESWQALVVMGPGAMRERVVQELGSAGFQVRIGNRQERPESMEEENRPHLLVIAGEPGEGDPSAVASAWTGRTELRPRAVVLIETLRAVDRLRAIAAGIDATIPGEQVAPALGRYARTLAHIGAPPSSVLLVEPDAPRAQETMEVLETANIRVFRCAQAWAVRELLERELPDLLLLRSRLPDGDPGAVTRMVRQDSRFHLLPVLLRGSGAPGERIEALRAGADDFLIEPVPPELLIQAVVTRAERGRRLRELVHRDNLTGLLNQATLLAELNHAVSHERIHGGPLAFLVLDLERFEEITERYGRETGDRVLLHVANVFRSNVRASDLIGRYGREEFGMVLRGGTAEGARVLAAKLSRVLSERPFPASAGEPLPITLSIGAASMPADGQTAAELARTAEGRARKQ